MLRLTHYEWWKDPKWRPQPQEDADGVLADGEVIRVPLTIMDETQRKAADILKREFSDDCQARHALDQAYEDHDRRKSEAWRNPPPLPLQTDASKPIPALQQPTDQMDARGQYLHRLQNAWRTP